MGSQEVKKDHGALGAQGIREGKRDRSSKLAKEIH